MKLRSELFYLIVFGPGFGESILLRTPEEDWVVIDGCRMPGAGDGHSPAVEMLQQQEAQWSAVVLTHPHLDHALGLDDVLALEGDGPIGCFPHPQSLPSGWSSSSDPETQYRAGSVEHVLAAIHDRWQQAPETRWELCRGTSKEVGSMQLTVLHPDPAAVKQAQGSLNRLSSATLVEWKNCRLLLGADVEAVDWESIAQDYPDLATHEALKYPHHGSAGAYHAAFAEGNQATIWLMTPYNRGRKLPRYDDGEGLHKALKFRDAVHLTGLPVRHDLQAQVPYETTRQALRDGQAPKADRKRLPGGFTFAAKPQTNRLDCYVAAGFDDRGSLVDLQHGAGAVTVTEEFLNA